MTVLTHNKLLNSHVFCECLNAKQRDSSRKRFNVYFKNANSFINPGKENIDE